jgi:hypothetical protein
MCQLLTNDKQYNIVQLAESQIRIDDLCRQLTDMTVARQRLATEMSDANRQIEDLDTNCR